MAGGITGPDLVDRKHTAVATTFLVRQQQVLVLLALMTDGRGVVAEQIDDGRAIQLYVFQARALALHTVFVEAEFQFDAATQFEGVFWQASQHVQPGHIDEQKLLLKGEIFLQVAIATEGVQWVWNQCFVFGEADGLDAGAWQRETGSLAIAPFQTFATAIQHT